jgi:hypothetical protein
MWLEQVVVGIKFKALVKQLKVHLFGQAHQTNSFVFYLSDDRLVILVL